MRKVIYFIFSVCCLWTFDAEAQEFRIDAPLEVLQNETFQVQVQILDTEPFESLPILRNNSNFEIVANPEYYHRSPSLFRNDYYMIQANYWFRAKKAGKFFLPQLELSKGKRKVVSEKQRIEVLSLPCFDDIAYFAEVESSKNMIAVGDTATITYKLYSTHKVTNILNYQVADIPSNNLRVVGNRSPSVLTPEEMTIDSRNYFVYTLKKVVVQAIAIGNASFAEGAITLLYSLPTDRVRTDAWGRSYEEYIKEQKICRVPSLELRIHNFMTI